MQADDWDALATQAAAAGTRLPPLPTFDEVRRGDRERWFAELGYTFWNAELVNALMARCRTLAARRWVELAAGTGRLTAELARRGLRVAATDSYAQTADQVRSFQRVIRYGEWVARMDAWKAVARLQPDAMLCAWPPLGSGVIPDLLARRFPGSGNLQAVVCIGEPGGASEMPGSPLELPDGWRMEEWPECERFLVGFNDPPAGPEFRSLSALQVYLRR